MKPKFNYNKCGVKFSCDKYRNIGGVYYHHWTSDPEMFESAIAEAKEEGLQTKIINGELYKEKKGE